MTHTLTEGQKAGLLALGKAPSGQYIYPEGHTSALCNLVGGRLHLIDRMRIKNRWHYRLTTDGRDAVEILRQKSNATIPS